MKEYRCPKHNTLLVQSPHMPTTWICHKCQAERISSSDFDGLYDVLDLEKGNILEESKVDCKYFLTNDRYVNGNIVQRALQDVLGIPADKAKYTVFKAHTEGKVELDCTDEQFEKLNKKMVDQGSNRVFKREKEVSGEEDQQEPDDVFYPRDNDNRDDDFGFFEPVTEEDIDDLPD